MIRYMSTKRRAETQLIKYMGTERRAETQLIRYMGCEKGQGQIQGNSGLKCGPLQNPIFSFASTVAEQLHKGGILTEMVEGKPGKNTRDPNISFLCRMSLL